MIPMSLHQNKIVVERFDALVNSGELRQLDELCTPDMVNHALAPTRPRAVAALLTVERQGQLVWTDPGRSPSARSHRPTPTAVMPCRPSRSSFVGHH